MSAGRTLRGKIVAKLKELQHLYEAGQITPDSNQYLDLLALKELQWNMVQLKQFAFFKDGENPEEMAFEGRALTSQTLH
ncbi:MAG: hypothetical protein ACLPSF_05265 [Methylocella sp.]